MKKNEKKECAAEKFERNEKDDKEKEWKRRQNVQYSTVGVKTQGMKAEAEHTVWLEKRQGIKTKRSVHLGK